MGFKRYLKALSFTEWHKHMNKKEKKITNKKARSLFKKEQNLQLED